MTKATRIGNAAAIVMCDALVDLFDSGTASPNAGYIEIYTTAQPAGVDVAVSGQTLLGTLTMTGGAGTAFGNAADDTPGAKATANTITNDTSADATGTAVWFRAYDSDGTAFVDGSITATGASPEGDMVLDDTSIVIGGTIALTSWTVTMPES